MDGAIRLVGRVRNPDGARARVVLEPLNRRIKIAISGANKKEALFHVRNDIEHIHETLNNPKVQKMVPCVCGQCRAGGEPGFFEHGVLNEAKEKGITELQCMNSFKQVPIDDLLSGIRFVPPNAKGGARLFAKPSRRPGADVDELALRKELESIENKLKALESKKAELDRRGRNAARWRAAPFLLGFAGINATLAYLTFARKEWGWNEVEPLAYFIGHVPLLLGYVYLLIANKDPDEIVLSPLKLYKRMIEKQTRRNYSLYEFDDSEYENLRQRAMDLTFAVAHLTRG